MNLNAAGNLFATLLGVWMSVFAIALGKDWPLRTLVILLAIGLVVCVFLIVAVIECAVESLGSRPGRRG